MILVVYTFNSNTREAILFECVCTCVCMYMHHEHAGAQEGLKVADFHESQVQAPVNHHMSAVLLSHLSRPTPTSYLRQKNRRSTT